MLFRSRLPAPAVALPPDRLGRFFHLLRAGFAQPRKQIHNVFPEELGLEPAEVRALIASVGIDPVARAQHLDLADWERLFHAIEARHPEALDVRD